MERLSDFAADIVNDLYENSDWYGDRSLIEAAINRLAAYKDTGLEPEEVNVIAGLASENCAKVADKIDQLLSDDKELEQYRALGPIDRLRELKQADDEGRCVVLPCKVGETVYTTRWFDTFWETCTDSRGELFRRKQFQHKVTKEKFSPFSLDYTGFGKTVFLTYEEAEAALEGMKNG